MRIEFYEFLLFLLCFGNSYKCDEFVVNDTLSGVIDSVRTHILRSTAPYVVYDVQSSHDVLFFN